MTPYGWQVEYLEASGRQFSLEFLGGLSNPGGASLAYRAFVNPGGSPKQAAGTLVGVLTVVGGPATLMPLPPGGEEYLTRKVFSKPGGGPHDPADVTRFLALWNTPARFVPAGSFVRNNADTNPTLVFEPDAIDCRVPIEVQLGGQGTGPGAAVAAGRSGFGSRGRPPRTSSPNWTPTGKRGRPPGCPTDRIPPRSPTV